MSEVDFIEGLVKLTDEELMDAFCLADYFADIVEDIEKITHEVLPDKARFFLWEQATQADMDSHTFIAYIFNHILGIHFEYTVNNSTDSLSNVGRSFNNFSKQLNKVLIEAGK